MTVTLRLTLEEAETLARMANAAWEQTDIKVLLPGEQRAEAARAVRVLDKIGASIKRTKAKAKSP